MAIEGRDHQHVITVDMEHRMNDMPKLLSHSAGRSSCCIFRVPQSLVGMNQKAYQPQIVSIGPYHHGKENVQMIEEHKWRYLKDLLHRTPRTGNRLDHYVSVVASMEGSIRESYSENLSWIAFTDLITMMVLDGLFIIELFCKVGGIVVINSDDTIFTMTWVLSFLMRDLLRLENQIPYFVLQKLFDESKGSRKDSDSSLATLTLGFFNYMVGRPTEVLNRHKNLTGKHLLDLFRKTYIPREMQRPKQAYVWLIPSAIQLHEAAVKFKVMKQADTFLDIKFHDRVLEIPNITMDDFTISFLLNCVAFEQCYCCCSNHFTSYVTFMGCLINTPIDARFLGANKIIENYFGTDDEAANFFISVCKDVAFDIEDSYLSETFADVNSYYRNYSHVDWRTLFSLFAGLVSILSLIQTFFAVFSYFRPKGP